jgi:hypothetical protein
MVSTSGRWPDVASEELQMNFSSRVRIDRETPTEKLRLAFASAMTALILAAGLLHCASNNSTSRDGRDNGASGS